jgi:hypothetical protein
VPVNRIYYLCKHDLLPYRRHGSAYVFNEEEMQALKDMICGKEKSKKVDFIHKNFAKLDFFDKVKGK